MPKLNIVEHPLIRHKMGLLRDKNTKTKDFRELLSEIATFVCFEATKDLKLSSGIEIETPVCKTSVCAVESEIVLVPVLRAGMGMLDGLLNLIPTAAVGHIGFYRDPETLKPVDYFCKLPGDLSRKDCFVLDPMLATGGTAVGAISFLKDKGANRIKFLSIVACPEGVKMVSEAHPDVAIYCAALDERLNDHGYIVPGLGDAGDRMFGTK